MIKAWVTMNKSRNGYNWCTRCNQAMFPWLQLPSALWEGFRKCPDCTSVLPRRMLTPTTISIKKSLDIHRPQSPQSLSLVRLKQFFPHSDLYSLHVLEKYLGTSPKKYFLFLQLKKGCLPNNTAYADIEIQVFSFLCCIIVIWHF